MTDAAARNDGGAGTAEPHSDAPYAGSISPQLLTERMLLSALREHDAAVAAEMARERAEFLAAACLRFGTSLDQELTYAAIAGLSLPGLQGWCVVDVIEIGGSIRRLAVMHPDEDKRVAAHALVDRWIPAADDRIGVPAIERDLHSVIVTERADDAVAGAAHDPETIRVLQWLGVGSLLVVPIVGHGILLGAITFVSRPGAPPYSADDVELGEAVAMHCAQALEAARLYAAARAAWAEAEAARVDGEGARAVAEMARLEAEQARRDADEANDAKTQFLRTMSHELRTPLNAISGYAQLMETGIYGPVTDEQIDALTRIRRSQVHLLSLINSVLHYAKLETGHAEFDIRSIELGDVLDWALSLVAPQARAHNITLAVGTTTSTDRVNVDPQRMRQIIVNLMSNAVKFTNPGGRVELSSEREESTVAIRVSDTGIGIPSDKVQSIFEPFMQVRSDLARPHQGTGLGLAISRELAHGMGGTLTVSSTLGAGSVFVLRLPVG
ncbi:MAG: ATP-binding protein [Gemmatimonadaceae bacterium]